ncbi:MAG: VOC family protein [Pseudomonadota bacterium]
MTPFHLAFPVRDLDETRAFYIDVLGCEQGRSSHTWTDFSLFGHQMSAHLRPGEINHSQGMVDGAGVPIPHFGVVLSMENWNALADRLSGREDVDWIMEPTRRFVGEPGEQATLFIRDPSGNALEFKGYASADAIFAT